jgi:glucose 1-dehydrogenase
MDKQSKDSVAFIPGRFRGEVAFVAGGARGIGKAIATRLALEGADVVIADIDRTSLSRTAEEIARKGCSVRPVTCDLSKRVQVERSVAKALQWKGKIDVVMQVAGIADPIPFLKMDERAWDRHMDINLKGAFLLAHAVLPPMVKRRSGRLVFMASTNCWDAEPELAHYNDSKARVFLLAKTLAREFGPYGIRSNAIGPGFIRTRLTESFFDNPEYITRYQSFIPLGRIGDPEDVAGPATFLASHDANTLMEFCCSLMADDSLESRPVDPRGRSLNPVGRLAAERLRQCGPDQRLPAGIRGELGSHLDPFQLCESLCQGCDPRIGSGSSEAAPRLCVHR